MLLALDVGNTNTVLGFFRGAELVAHAPDHRARPDRRRAGILTRELFTIAGIDPASVSGVIIKFCRSAAQFHAEEMSERYLHEGAFIELA
jgi:type III pantothenate kinase